MTDDGWIEIGPAQLRLLDRGTRLKLTLAGFQDVEGVVLSTDGTLEKCAVVIRADHAPGARADRALYWVPTRRAWIPAPHFNWPQRAPWYAPLIEPFLTPLTRVADALNRLLTRKPRP